VTGPRRAVVEAVLGATGHLTADELAARTQAALPDVHRSTVYRTLAALEELGVLYHVHLAHGPAVYHLVEDAHAHVVCESCEAVAEVWPAALEALAAEVRRRSGFVLSPQHFSLTGHCPRCAGRGGAGRREEVARARPRT
jgi:Fur family ferric uptake transcriptional regulator